MSALRVLSVASLLLVTACDSKVTSEVLDPALQERVNAFLDCFPNLYERADQVLEMANSWRVGTSTPIPDPAGLTFSVGADGGGTVVNVTYVVDATTLSAQIRFYSPTGVQQTLAITGFATLNATIDEAANLLRNQFGATNPFMVGDYSLSGGGISATGEALTGIIGGATNQNELEELRSTLTSAAIAGGPPAVDPSTITDSGPPVCTLQFNIPSLLTDETPTQQYPIGTITFVVTSPNTTLNASLVLDGSNTGVLTVTDIPGTFSINLDTLDVTYVP